MNDKECMIIDFFSNLCNNISEIEPSMNNEEVVEFSELVETDLKNNVIYLSEYIINEKYDYLGIFEKLIEKHIKKYVWSTNESVKVL